MLAERGHIRLARVVGPIFGLGAVGLGTAAVGPTLVLGGVVALIGAIYAAVTPVTALGLNLFANTSFQILGSAHIIGLPTSLTKLVGALTVGAWLAHWLFCRWPLIGGPLLRPILAFLAIVFVWGLFLQNADTGWFEGTIRYVQIMLLTLLIANIAGQSSSALRQTVIWLSAAVATCGIVGTAEHFLPSLAIASDDPRLGLGTLGGVMDKESLDGVVIKRVTGGIGDANWLAYSIAIAAPLLVYLWHRTESVWLRSAVLLFAALQAAALFFSYTRTGFLGLGVAVLYLLIRRQLPLIPTFYGAVGIATVGLIYTPPGFLQRMFSSTYLEQGSTYLRQTLIRNAVRIWLESPWVGFGYNGYGERFYYDVIEGPAIRDPRLLLWAVDLREAVLDGTERIATIGTHNLALELLVEYGIVGAATYFSIFLVAMVGLIRVERVASIEGRQLAICLQASLIAFLVCGLLGHAKFLKLAWIVLGLTMALMHLARAGEMRPVDLLGRRV